MSSSLTSLPRELVRDISSWLLSPDQAALCRTCKALNALLTPIVWSEIELHHRGTHEGIDIPAVVANFENGEDWNNHDYLRNKNAHYPYKNHVFEPSHRKYAECGFDPSEWKKRYHRKEEFFAWPYSSKNPSAPSREPTIKIPNNQFGREEKFISVHKITSEGRWNQLARYVCSLCMSIGVDDEVVMVIGSLQNLKSLELVGLAKVEDHAPTAVDIVLPRLENLKLRGYFSSALVRQICNNAEHIKYLDLGLLATSTDDEAYKDTLLAARGTRAPVIMAQAEHYQRNGSEALAVASISSLPVTGDLENNDDEDDEETNYDEEWFRHMDDDDVWPWALHGPIWLPRSLPPRLTSLTHLHLVKPYTGETEIDVRCDGFSDIPHRYEQVLCIEWRLLLQGVGHSLKELILEHRAPAARGDCVGDGDPHPLKKKLWNWADVIRSSAENDRGDELFCKSVLRLLLEQNSHFSNLRHLALRGIRINGLATQIHSVVESGGDTALNDERLRKAYPYCEIELFEDPYPIDADSDAVFTNDAQYTNAAIQDEGDGLLHSLWFYNDYRKRYGPQWRVFDQVLEHLLMTL
ncbi:hypothetical protein SUNI508_06725 [Seiridium unicorne]|uniref:F-box domain-containing protein n=1 Tax=Seiridium unicorne TaxID=138068 RepID=A0ABR2V000_9PEZI